MTEQIVPPAGVREPRPSRVAGRAGLAAAALAVGAAGAWLLRAPILEALASAHCRERQLVCEVDVAEAGFGGVRIDGLVIRQSPETEALLSAETLKVGFAWSAPWSVRVDEAAAARLDLRLSLLPDEPLLGALDRLVPDGGGGGPAPALRLDEVVLRFATEAGDVVASGALVSDSIENFTLTLATRPLSLAVDGARVEVREARLEASSDAGGFRASGALDLGWAGARGSVDRLTTRVTAVEEAGGTGRRLRYESDTVAVQLAWEGGSLARVEAKATAESEPLSLGEPPSPEVILGALRKLSLTADLAEGRAGAAGWAGASIRLDLAGEAGSARGPLRLEVDRPSAAGVGARSAALALNLAVQAPGGDVAQTRIQGGGAATVTDGRAAFAADVARAAVSALAPVSPELAAGLGGALQAAGEVFDASAGMTVAWSGDGGEAAADDLRLEAASGAQAAFAGADGPEVVWRLTDGGGVKASGRFEASGGGLPRLSASIGAAHAGPHGASLSGSMRVEDWRAGDASAALKLDALDVSATRGAGGDAARASAEVSLSAGGEVFGGRWRALEAAYALSAVWDGGELSIATPEGARARWRGLDIGGVQVGPGRLVYAPKGEAAAVVRDGAAAGSGRIEASRIDARAGEVALRMAPLAAEVDWSTHNGGLRAAFRTGAAALAMDAGPLPVEASTDALAGRVTLDADGLRIEAPEALVRLVDPRGEDERVFEPLDLEGRLAATDAGASFEGAALHAGSGVQLARGTVRHAFASGVGRAEFAPAPILFRARGLQPADISPLLRGPANVAGRIDVGGAVDWTREGAASRASFDVRDLHFTLAQAGVFEGVSGRFELTDVFALESEPGQSLDIREVTLGLPLKDGRVRFQFAGREGVRLETAEWPFAGGRLTLAPSLWRFGAGENRLLARAEDWDFARLLTEFRIPDLQAEGVLEGSFPIVLTTGSARIAGAQLRATGEGVLRYSGSVGDAAASTDETAGLLFEALKDFRFRVLSLGLDGDLAGRMMLTLSLEGRNPAVLEGSDFAIGVSVDSALTQLLRTLNQGEVRALIREAAVSGGESGSDGSPSGGRTDASPDREEEDGR